MPVHRIDPLIFTDFRNATLGVWTDVVTQKTVTAAAARSALPVNQRNDPVRIAAKLTDLLQSQLDVRIPLADLPVDDLDKTVNPNRPDLFWDLATLELVGRAVKVTVSWVNNLYELKLERTN